MRRRDWKSKIERHREKDLEREVTKTCVVFNGKSCSTDILRMFDVEREAGKYLWKVNNSTRYNDVTIIDYFCVIVL